MSQIGFVGLGIMGKPMSHNLLKVGHSLVVYDVVPGPIAELEAAGAARGAFGSVRGAGSAMLERAGSAGALANRASSQVTEKLTADPWLLGVVGFVGGALLAAMLPPTTIERAYFGEACNGLRNKANELGHEAAERVRELADPATRTTTH